MFDGNCDYKTSYLTASKCLCHKKMTGRCWLNQLDKDMGPCCQYTAQG